MQIHRVVVVCALLLDDLTFELEHDHAMIAAKLSWVMTDRLFPNAVIEESSYLNE